MYKRPIITPYAPECEGVQNHVPIDHQALEYDTSSDTSSEGRQDQTREIITPYAPEPLPDQTREIITPYAPEPAPNAAPYHEDPPEQEEHPNVVRISLNDLFPRPVQVEGIAPPRGPGAYDQGAPLLPREQERQPGWSKAKKLAAGFGALAVVGPVAVGVPLGLSLSQEQRNHQESKETLLEQGKKISELERDLESQDELQARVDYLYDSATLEERISNILSNLMRERTEQGEVNESAQVDETLAEGSLSEDESRLQEIYFLSHVFYETLDLQCEMTEDQENSMREILKLDIINRTDLSIFENIDDSDSVFLDGRIRLDNLQAVLSPAVLGWGVYEESCSKEVLDEALRKPDLFWLTEDEVSAEGLENRENLERMLGFELARSTNLSLAEEVIAQLQNGNLNDIPFV